MCVKLGSAISIIMDRVVALVTICTALALGSTAHAVTINFDDLVFTPGEEEFYCWCDNPVTDQYLSQGLVISEGYLAQYGPESAHPVSQPNYLIGGNYLKFSFVGPLPTSVGMYVSSFHEESIFLNAFDAAGQMISAKTSGWAGPFDDTPYQPNQYISFTSPIGFTGVSLEGFYNMRVSAAVDDLTYEYASVPEPPSLILLGVGLLGFACLRLRLRLTEK